MAWEFCNSHLSYAFKKGCCHDLIGLDGKCTKLLQMTNLEPVSTLSATGVLNNILINSEELCN